MQAYMAQIRGEAVHARKLAEQIDNMSQNVPTQTRKQVVMTDSTTIGSGETREKQRRASNKPRTAKVRSSFNPLHPSMELPPEQLIRLLGLESKKIRKHKRAQTATAHQTTASPGTSNATLPPGPECLEPSPGTNKTPAARSTHRQREYERAKEQGKSKNRRSLWLPALATGLICGIAGSIYLFWMQPEHGAATIAATPVPSKVNHGLISSTPRKPVAKTPASAAKSKPVPAAKNDPAWLATIEARGKHLREEAKQRFEQRLKQTVQVPSIAAVPINPQPEVLTTDKPALVTTTGAPEAMTTGMPAVEPEAVAHDETLAENTDNSTASLVTEPVDTSLQTPETPSIEDSNTIELIAEQVPAATTEPTDQPGGENVLSTPALDTLTREGAAELF